MIILLFVLNVVMGNKAWDCEPYHIRTNVKSFRVNRNTISRLEISYRTNGMCGNGYIKIDTTTDEGIPRAQVIPIVNHEESLEASDDEPTFYLHSSVVRASEYIKEEQSYNYRIYSGSSEISLYQSSKEDVTYGPYKLRIPSEQGGRMMGQMIFVDGEVISKSRVQFKTWIMNMELSVDDVLIIGEDTFDDDDISDITNIYQLKQNDNVGDLITIIIGDLVYIQLPKSIDQQLIIQLEQQLMKSSELWTLVITPMETNCISTLCLKLNSLYSQYGVDLVLTQDQQQQQQYTIDNLVSFNQQQTNNQNVQQQQAFEDEIVYNYNHITSISGIKLLQFNGNQLQLTQLNSLETQANNLNTQLLDQKSTTQSSSSNCLPYGQRITLGYYFTYSEDSTDIANIAFNTLSFCPGAYVLISDNFGYESILPLSTTRVLNMTKIYENSTIVNYDYVTYINIVQLGIQNIPGDNITYHYTIRGDNDNEIGPFTFRIPGKKHNENEHRKFLFFGDMDSNWAGGNASNYTFNWLQARTSDEFIEKYDMMVFEGDMAYDLESNNCQMGDQWLRNMSVFTSYYPFMVAPGNHDAGNNSDYPYLRRTFLSPHVRELDSQKFYSNFYSFDLGLAHFIFYNPDWIVYGDAPAEYTALILGAFEDDLKKAQANREQVPWIIVVAHYPMYCSDDTDFQCGNNNVALRGFADLFTLYGVEMYMSAHQHNYERDSPFINNHTAQFETEGPRQHMIKNSNAPVYIIEGAAGNDYYMPTTPYAIQPYTVAQSEEDGIGQITIFNSTHLLFEHIKMQTNEVVDYVYVIKDRIPVPPDPDHHITIILIIFGIVVIITFIIVCLFLGRRERIKGVLLP